MVSRWLSRCVLMLGAFIALLGIAAPAGAQPGVAGKAVKVCVLPATPGSTAAQVIRTPEKFDCTTPQIDFGPGDYWVITQDINKRSRSREPLSIRTASLWQNGMDFHTLYADGTLHSWHSDARGVTPLVQLGAIVEYPLPRNGPDVVRALWHVKGSANMRGILLGAQLAASQESQNANLRMAAIYAAFGGLCIALIVYNLALWGALRHRFQLYYCAMVAALLLYALTSSGTLAWIFPEISNNFRLRINYLFLGTSGAMALIFARSFFEERVFAGWVGKATAVVTGGIALAGLAFFLFAPFAVRTVDSVFTFVFVALGVVIVPTLWRAWRKRSNFLWLFALAWAAPILFSCLRVAANLRIIQWNFWLDNSTLLSMAAEALLSSLAIAYRIRLLSRERDQAMASEEKAWRLADTDPLTGLLNRRAFLERAIGRDGDQLLLLADLDHFKRVNETLGHDGGDEVLRVFARVLRGALPATALVARMGGEEFAIIAHAHDPVDANALLAKLRATRMPFDVQITASIGTCHGPMTSERDWKAMYRGADAALFEAKSAGRDRAKAAPEREAA